MKSLAERRQASARIGSRYYTVARHRDTILKEEIGRRLPPEGAFLDGGCGRNLFLARQLRDRCRLSVGLDYYPMDVLEHGLPGLQADLAAMGLVSDSFDVIASRSVAEHLPDPEAVFREISRVLKPGGSALLLCPNKWYYASVLGRLVPGRAAGRILSTIFGRSVYDNFPTYYRANTKGAVRRLATRAGLTLESVLVNEHPPDYLKLSPTLYRIGMIYDRVTVGWRRLNWLATSFIFVMRKPGGDDGS